MLPYIKVYFNLILGHNNVIHECVAPNAILFVDAKR